MDFLNNLRFWIWLSVVRNNALFAVLFVCVKICVKCTLRYVKICDLLDGCFEHCDSYQNEYDVAFAHIYMLWNAEKYKLEKFLYFVLRHLQGIIKQFLNFQTRRHIKRDFHAKHRRYEENKTIMMRTHKHTLWPTFRTILHLRNIWLIK